MARIRSIKPEFWSSEQVMECSTIARLLFIGLWNFADDKGRHPASGKQIKALVFPGDDISSTTVRGLLDELEANGLIEIYTVEDKEFFQITGWHHQKIDRPQPSKFPAPPDMSQEQSSNDRRTDVDGGEGIGGERNRSAAAASACATGLDPFEAKCRAMVEHEPIMLAQDFHVITALLAEGVTHDDIRIGIREALDKRSDKQRRYRHWHQLAGWCRSAAKNRLAKGPAAGGAKPEPDDPSDPRIDFGGGYSAQVSTIRMVLARGTWIDHWGPRIGEPGCRIPTAMIPLVQLEEARH